MIPDTKDDSPGDLHDLYASHLATDVGLESFEQFVFLQHFLLTFDERRHLLFWDPKVLGAVLHLAFGISSGDAKRAETLRRDAERAASRGRNYKWQSTDLRKKITELEKELKKATNADSAPEDLLQKHKDLTKRLDKAERTVERLDAKVQDNNTQLAELSARDASLRAQYAEEFSKRMQNRSSVAANPLVVSSLANRKCGLCGAKGAKPSAEIAARVKAPSCPLCGTGVEDAPPLSRDIKRLQAIDADLTKNRAGQDKLLKRVTRLSEEFSSAAEERDEVEQELVALEDDNAKFLKALSTPSAGGDTVQTMLASYREHMAELQKKSKEQYARRDEKQDELRRIESALGKQYAAVEGDFVPLFVDLAHGFLGLDLGVQFEPTRAGVSLVLEVRSTRRRRPYQLSESQRFFVDIALRMALARFMAASDSVSCLYIDTPEGSLDIAYEKRAGDMLAKFVGDSQRLVMTANINTSQLLRSLAEACGENRMEICRMTDWTELSEVQVAEERLFEDAFATIETALRASESARD